VLRWRRVTWSLRLWGLGRLQIQTHIEIFAFPCRLFRISSRGLRSTSTGGQHRPLSAIRMLSIVVDPGAKHLTLRRVMFITPLLNYMNKFVQIQRIVVLCHNHLSISRALLFSARSSFLNRFTWATSIRRSWSSVLAAISSWLRLRWQLEGGPHYLFRLVSSWKASLLLTNLILSLLKRNPQFRWIVCRLCRPGYLLPFRGRTCTELLAVTKLLTNVASISVVWASLSCFSNGHCCGCWIVSIRVHYHLFHSVAT